MLVHASVHSLDNAFAHGRAAPVSARVRLPITASTRCDASTTPPPRSPVANCPPFRMSARSAWACHAHSKPRRCQHLMPPQLQCPHVYSARSESPINRCIRAEEKIIRF
ncbi:hypothetical protein ACLOJK_009948 [Asimina triloba]